ncbi:recombinase family protein [Rhodobacteraceae bacterium]|nr:recombinase family protein [Paracoccaceae bacterium]
MKTLRCAIYTRKSSEDGLEQEFNSLDAQREACAAYIASQKHEGWVLLPKHYDDGGLSGGSLERPALRKLLQDIADGRVDQIVVYKIDRLTRSLADFSKIVGTLDAAEASFVSVTQSFNTATSMGRLTLNMLLSFAQFEREVTAERIRDKIAASKRKGLWMGGLVPLGYDADGRTLKINEAEAKTVRKLYRLYVELGTVRSVKEAAEALGLRSKRRLTSAGKQSGGGPFDRGHIHQILTNPIYAGRIRHKTLIHDGQHEAIIEPDRWDRVQVTLQAGTSKSRTKKTAKQSSLLCGKIYDETGDRLTPSHTKTRAGARRRYYVSHRLIKNSGETGLDGWRLPAEELETKVGHVVGQRISRSSFIENIAPDMAANDISEAKTRIHAFVSGTNQRSQLAVIQRIDLGAGELCIALDCFQVAKLLDCDPEFLSQDPLEITAPFQLRKRGVETKLIFAKTQNDRDDVLINNIAKAHHWFDQIKFGKTFAEVAADNKTSKRRIQQMIELAFLPPDIVRNVMNGTQPLGFTSDWCLRHDIPTSWDEQRALIATL